MSDPQDSFERKAREYEDLAYNMTTGEDRVRLLAKKMREVHNAAVERCAELACIAAHPSASSHMRAVLLRRPGEGGQKP